MIISPSEFYEIVQTVLGNSIVYLQDPSIGFHIFTEQSSPPEAISPVINVVKQNTNPL